MVADARAYGTHHNSIAEQHNLIFFFTLDILRCWHTAAASAQGRALGCLMCLQLYDAPGLAPLSTRCARYHPA